MIDTFQDALKQAMKIETFIGYPDEHRLCITSSDHTIIGLQHHITDLIDQLKDIHHTQPL